MERLLYFDYCALIMLVILLFSIYFHRMTRGLVNRCFILLVYSCLGSTVLDLATEIFRESSLMTQETLWFEEVLTYCYYIFRWLNAMTYMIYLISLTDTWHKVAKSKGLKALLVLPGIAVIASLVVNKYTGIIFYFNEQLDYVRGDYISIIHVSILTYVVYGMYFVWSYRVLFSRAKQVAIFAMFPLIYVSVMIQYLFSPFLVEMFAMAIAIMMLIIIVQRPDENINTFFEIRNYQAYWNDLRRTFHNEKEMDVLYIHVINYNTLISALGEESARELLKKTIVPIRAICKNYKVRADLYYLNHGCISVFLNSNNHMKTEQIATDISHLIKNDKAIRKSGLSMIAQICILHCQEDVKSFKAASIIYNVLKNQTAYTNDIIYASDIMAQNGYEIKSNIDSIINDALENDRFELYYQPIYSTEQKKFNSAEALIRLYNENYGFISPDLFIPAAEKSGAIHQIGIFVFEEICRFIKSEEFDELGLDYIEINLSVTQCMQTSLAKDLLEILHKYNVSPEKINLEITETAVESSFEIMMDNLNELAKEGITFSLDDYGTGFSNIQRIITMPLSIVKLDKSFIDEIHNPDYQVIVTNTIKMLKDLNLKIVSEGVEAEKQLAFLHENHCDFIQGYYFSKPLPKEDFVSFVKKQGRES